MTTLRRVAICKPLRTPVGKFLGSLAPLEAGALGAGEALPPPLAAELDQQSRRLISRYVRQLQREAGGEPEAG